MLSASIHRFHSLSTDLALLQIANSQEELQHIQARSIKNGSFVHLAVSSRILSLYASMGDVESARSLFDNMSQPSSVCWNSIIKCYVESSCSDEALVLFGELVSRTGMPVDNFIYPCVIKACSRLNAIAEGKQIHGLVVKSGSGGDIYVQGSLLSLYSKFGDMELAGRVFERMSCRDLVAWNSLIDGHAKCGSMDVAKSLFDDMPERDVFSYTALVDGYSKCGNVNAARNIFDQMTEKNVISWNAMVDGYMRNRDVASARELFNEMPAKSVATWNIMISGLELNGQFLDAIVMFLKMLENDANPNHATFVCTLSAVSELGAIGYARFMHSYVNRTGVEIDGVLGTALIHMYSKCGCIESALRVFNSISRRKIGHWTAVIVGLGTHGMAAEALDLFMEMQKSGGKPNDITLIGVLNACSHGGEVDKGRHYFKEMIRKYGITPTIEHYGCMVDLLCRTGHLDEAKEVIENMPMTPNKVIWMSLLSGCKTHKSIDMGEYAAKKVAELDPTATGSYLLLSNIYASAKLWNKVSEIREAMKLSKVRKDPGRSSIEHEGVMHNFVAGDQSHPKTEEIYSKLEEMVEKLKAAGHKPDTTQVFLYFEDDKDKEAELAVHGERLAMAFGLITLRPSCPIRIVKNLRVCNDCHVVTKLLSEIYNREIIVRDGSRFHHFKNGYCSCKDFW